MTILAGSLLLSLHFGSPPGTEREEIKVHSEPTISIGGKALKVPTWARLESAKLDRAMRVMVMTFQGVLPPKSADHCSVEVFLWPIGNRERVSAIYHQRLGSPMAEALRNRVFHGEAVLWHEGGNASLSRPKVSGRTVQVKLPDGFPLHGRVIQRIYVEWSPAGSPRDAHGDPPTVSWFARPGDVLMEEAMTFAEEAEKHILDLPKRAKPQR